MLRSCIARASGLRAMTAPARFMSSHAVGSVDKNSEFNSQDNYFET